MEADKRRSAIKGSYFPNEQYDFDSCDDKLPLFVEMLKSRGCYISEDGHIRSKKGGLMSKLTRNGYYLTMAQYNKKCYYFCEHRVVWVWHNGPIPEGLVINHKDYNRANNKIENLELMTQKENTEYSRPNFKPCFGEKSSKAKLTDKQAQAIRHLGVVCGWSVRQIKSILGLTDMSEVNVGRIRNGKRYPHVSPGSVLEVYPTIVDFTRNKNISLEEELKNYCLGLCGEVGEVVDMVKKMLYHGHEINPVELMLELGDVLYYLVAIGNVLGFDFDLVALNNNAKLMARYPNGFSVAGSIQRIEEIAANGAVSAIARCDTSTVTPTNGDNR